MGKEDLEPGGGGITDGASDHVKDLANDLIKGITKMLAPKKQWAPETPDSWLYEQFLWLGQHLAIVIFICVVVVCGLTAWQGTPRLKQMGASTGWTLAAVAGMASVPGAVMLLNTAVSEAFMAAFNSNETTLFKVIEKDLETGADSGNPLALLLIIAALVVSLAFAGLVFMTRTLGIVAFVCMAPLVLASLARGGDTSAVKTWAMRLLGLMFAPFALLLISPFVEEFGGSLIMDTVLLVAADVLMLRMIFHGVPYIGPKVARGARTFVENRTDNRWARKAVAIGAPAFDEKEDVPRGPRVVPTPGRAVGQDQRVLLGAYGIRQQQRPGRLTTASAVAQTGRDAARAAQIRAARQQARAANQPATPAGAGAGANAGAGARRSPTPASPAPGSPPQRGQRRGP